MRKTWPAAAALAACLVCAWLSYHATSAKYADSQMAIASQRLASESAALDSLLVRNESLPRILALQQRIAAVLQAPDDASRRAAANLYLQQVAERGQLLAAYVLDSRGLTLAASNWNQPKSFVGHNYAFRPYFRDALAHGFGRFYAVGSTTGEPGYFLAAKVAAGAGVTGVVAVKVSLQGLQAAGLGGEALAVVDEFGVIFLASEPSLAWRPLAPLADAAIATLRATQRYGDRLGAPLRAQQAPVDSPLSIQVDGTATRVRMLSQPVGTVGWRMVSFVDVGKARWAGWLGAATGGLAMAFVMAMSMVAHLRRRRAAEIVKSRDELRHSEARLRAVANNLPVMVCFVDPSQRYVFANALYAQMYDTTGSALEGQLLSDVLDPMEYAAILPQYKRALAGETVVFEREYRKTRMYRCFEATYRPEWNLAHTEVTGVHVMTQEVTETKRRLGELARLSQLDHLTQLLNRKGFEATLDGALRQARDGSMLALLFIDLDGFKPVNDTFGHAVGDAVLCAFSKRLARLVRADDAVARLGGDEFAVLLPAIAEAGIAGRLAAAIVSMAARPFDVDGTTVNIGASVGVACHAGGVSIDARTLCRCADAYLYEAKGQGKRSFAMGPVGSDVLLGVH